MSTTVTYKGNTLTTINNATKTLKTAGKYMEGDVILTDNNTLSLQSKIVTPSTSQQTVSADNNYDGLNSVTVEGDADLIADNIISTANIFGIQGSVIVQNYYTGNSVPASTLGQNGDIYLQE